MEKEEEEEEERVNILLVLMPACCACWSNDRPLRSSATAPISRTFNSEFLESCSAMFLATPPNVVFMEPGLLVCVTSLSEVRAIMSMTAPPNTMTFLGRLVLILLLLLLLVILMPLLLLLLLLIYHCDYYC